MNKKPNASVAKIMTSNAIQAFENGEGNRAIGVSSSIEVGNTYRITGIDYRTAYFAPKDMSDQEFAELSEEKRAEVGVKRGWWEFVTDNGGLSFSAVMGVHEMYTTEFWAVPEDKTPEQVGIALSSDFDVTKIFKPSARLPQIWIDSLCDGIVGKTLVCIGVKNYQRGNFEAKARAFIVQ